MNAYWIGFLAFQMSRMMVLIVPFVVAFVIAYAIRNNSTTTGSKLHVEVNPLGYGGADHGLNCTE
jgi:hypothetical protein